nr:DsrE family protein [uncultured Cellulosilyticum sp.]
MYNEVVIINSDTLGRGDEEVGRTLLGTFLRKVLASLDKPDAIIFYNSGVKLVTRDSHFRDILEALESGGVELLACGTCVYSVCGKRSLAVGRITDMEEIADIVLKAQKVVTL